MSNQPEPLDLDTTEARANAATPGPWKEHDDPWNGKPLIYSGEEWGRTAQSVIRSGAPEYGEEQGYECSDADIAFIVAARTDVPALVAEVRRLRADLEFAKEGLALYAALHISEEEILDA